MNDLSNKETQILAYLKTVLGNAFPNADIRPESEFMETFAVPHVKLYNPLIDFVDKLKLMQSLENAELLSQEEMDDLGASLYKTRKPGFESEGTIIFVLNDLPDDLNLTITAFSIEATDKNGERAYRNYETIVINEYNASSYYDPIAYNYKIPIRFESIGVGDTMNAAPGEITVCRIGQPKYLKECYNEAPFIGGTNIENNVAFAQRIKEEMFAPNLGIERGYKNYANQFIDVKEVLVAGYMHRLMQRDVIGEVEVPGIKFAEGIKKLHWGTKVDLYLRGRTPVAAEDILEIQKKDDGTLYVKLKNVPVLDITSVKMFSYLPEFDDPENNQELEYVKSYTLVKDEEFETYGTLEEDAYIHLFDSRLKVGNFVRVEYRYNQLLENIHNDLYYEDNRPPTADIKLKEAYTKPLYGGMTVKMFTSLGLRDSNRSYIRGRLTEWVEQKTLGEELQFSDLLEPIVLKSGINVDAIVDYIHLPYQFFVADNESRFLFYTMSEEKRNIVTYFEKHLPPLAAIFNRYKDIVTVYDFFDFFHCTTTDNMFESSINEISYQSYENGHMVNTFRLVRNMVMRSEAQKRLSPGKITIEEHHYYELGDVFLYEDYDYTVADWTTMLENLKNLSLLGKTTDDGKEDINDTLRLALYYIVVMRIITNPKVLSTPEELIKFAKELVDRMPIQSEFE